MFPSGNIAFNVAIASIGAAAGLNTPSPTAIARKSTCVGGNSRQ